MTAVAATSQGQADLLRGSGALSCLTCPISVLRPFDSALSDFCVQGEQERELVRVTLECCLQVTSLALCCHIWPLLEELSALMIIQAMTAIRRICNADPDNNASSQPHINASCTVYRDDFAIHPHQEASWNPYYAHLALKLAAAAKSHRFTLQYCLWDQVSAVFDPPFFLIPLSPSYLPSHSPSPVRLSLCWHHPLVVGPSCQKRNALVQTEILISY